MKLVPKGINTAIKQYIMNPEIVNLTGDIGQVSHKNPQKASQLAV